MTTPTPLEPIPQPPGHLLVGNLFDLHSENLVENFMALAREYGPIYRLDLPGGNSRIIVSGVDLVDELCDESRFDKMLGSGLRALNEGAAGHGLFTSETTDPLWHKAHNILLPAFSQDAMRNYHAMMLDIAVQLMQKWERLNPDDSVDVTADTTRLTLDTIALCGFGYLSNSLYSETSTPCVVALDTISLSGFGYRFNSIYRETPHPFVVAMLGALSEAQARGKETAIQQKLHRKMGKLQASEELMAQTVRRILEERRDSGAI